MEKNQEEKEKIIKLIQDEQLRHGNRIVEIQAEKTKKIKEIEDERDNNIKQIESFGKNKLAEWNQKLNEVKYSEEKKAADLKTKQKEENEQAKNIIKNEGEMKKKNLRVRERDENLEKEIIKEKEEIQKLMSETQKLLDEARQNKKEIDFYEYNFGNSFFSQELRNQINEGTREIRDKYNNSMNEKMKQYNEYKIKDEKLKKFLQVAQTYPIMFQYIIPQVYQDFFMPPQMPMNQINPMNPINPINTNQI